jgi:hypothetical protein
MAKQLIVLAIVMLSGACTRPALSQNTALWSGGGGNWAPCPEDGNALWNTCGNNPPAYPTANYDAVIQGGPVTQNSGASVVNLTISAGDILVTTPGYLYITGTSISNNGSILIGAGNGLVMDGTTTTLSGTGTVTLTDPNASLGGASGVGPTLIIQQPVSGHGTVGVYANITNQSTIQATAGTLTVQSEGSSTLD